MSNDLVDCILHRVRDVSNECIDLELSPERSARYVAEIELHREILRLMFGDRDHIGPVRGMADSGAYFEEKISKMAIYAKMAVDPTRRENFSGDKILENLRVALYSVERLLPKIGGA